MCWNMSRAEGIGVTKCADHPDDECDERFRDELIPLSVSPTPDKLVSPSPSVQNKPLQQADWGDFYRVHNIPARHYSWPQLGDHNLYDDGSAVSACFSRNDQYCV
jgi:hypothetical protein